ncbi:hypothetical protein V496_10248, partial [Pseudogymnoascus sp. VKM F-4515 (FW-2607)]
MDVASEMGGELCTEVMERPCSGVVEIASNIGNANGEISSDGAVEIDSNIGNANGEGSSDANDYSQHLANTRYRSLMTLRSGSK